MTDLPRDADPAYAADLVLYGGTVRTLGGARTRATALAARGGRIVEVGDDRAALALAGPRTDVRDLRGGVAVPGFIETHNHPIMFGMTLNAQVDAGTPPNDAIGDIVERVRAAVRDTPPGEWVQGYRYDDTLLREGRHPTRADLDPVSPDHPVLLKHVSGHLAVANSAALRLMGVDRDTPDPPGGRYGRDDRGELTGVLAETATFGAQEVIGSPGPEELEGALERAGAAFLEHGVTTVHDTGIGMYGGAADIGAYRSVIGDGRFRTRVYGFLFHRVFRELTSGRLSPLEAAVHGLGDDRFRLGSVKIIADGSIQGLTGALAADYHCAPGERGILLHDQDELNRMVGALHEAGWHIGIHGNGDAGIQAILDAYAHVGMGRGEDRRHRVEHCQAVRDDQLDAIAALGVHPSFFVKHVYYWGDRHRDLFLGPERGARISPLAAARRRGIPFGLHSDCPITPIPPLEGIRAAVTRRTRDGRVLGAEQAVDGEAALRGYTSDAARLGFEEDRKGTLEPGKYADIAVLSADPTEESADLDAVRVDATVIGGEVVYSRT
ncbi:MAG TPA: amidohydrolase [Streptosporangiaceae bacterium]